MTRVPNSAKSGTPTSNCDARASSKVRLTAARRPVGQANAGRPESCAAKLPPTGSSASVRTRAAAPRREERQDTWVYSSGARRTHRALCGKGTNYSDGLQSRHVGRRARAGRQETRRRGRATDRPAARARHRGARADAISRCSGAASIQPNGCPWWAGTTRCSCSMRASSRWSRTSSASGRISASCRRSRTAGPRYYDYAFHYRDGRERAVVRATRPRDEIWIDYICDTGDGWNSDLRGCVRRVAAGARRRGGRRRSALPAPARRPAGLWRRRGLSDPEPRRVSRPADCPLGDGVRRRRPTSRHTCSRSPATTTGTTACSAFARLFCSDVGGRHFAGFRTRQRRSYFALKLPCRWWLIGSRTDSCRRISTRHRSNTSGRSRDGTCRPATA